MRLLRLLPLYRAAAVAADPRDGRGDHVRAQLERLSAAAGGAEPRSAVSVAARHHGVPGRVLDRLASRTRLHYAYGGAGGGDVLRRAAVHHRGPDHRFTQGLKPMIRNPILPGFNPDPSICRVGADYYIATSTFEWYPGAQIHHSRDLVNWRLLTRPLN